MYRGLNLVPKTRILSQDRVVEELSKSDEVRAVRPDGVFRSENVGISSINAGENPAHRKPKVSWATKIVPGLVGPKVRPKGVADGQAVNIRLLLFVFKGVTPL
jgi:hypothetical protein